MGKSPQEAKEILKPQNKMEAFPFSSNYVERELHTRHLGSPAMMWAHARARRVLGHAPPKYFDKNDEI